MAEADVPTCRGVDHVALTVPDLDQAVAFFRDAFGARELYRRHWDAGEGGDATMARQFNVHPEAAFRLAKIDIGGFGLELFVFSAPDLDTRVPRNCDAGGGHLALVVDDVDATAGRLGAIAGVRLLGEVSEIAGDHPLAGRRWIYLLTPWGAQLELVSPIGGSPCA